MNDIRQIALTFDIEGITHANVERMQLISKKDAYALEKELDYILELCEKLNAKATFFVVAELASQYQSALVKICDAGHEIACHSLSHKLLYTLSPKELHSEIHKSKQILEDATGQEIFGFRAPSWSVSKQMADSFYDLLANAGYLYSSSVFPGKTFLYGIPDAPKRPHKHTSGVIEFPMPVIQFLGKRLGYTGGFYYRLLPFFITKKWIENSQVKGLPLFLYFHPWEFAINPYHFKARAVDKMILTLNRHLLHTRIERLFANSNLEGVSMHSIINRLSNL